MNKAEKYNHLVKLRNECYRDRIDRETEITYFTGFNDGYEKGEEAGKIHWHDLEKDPNDLPKKNKSYWVYMNCQGNKIYRSVVWQGCWCGWDGIPLAWCEEPQFEKETEDES